MPEDRSPAISPLRVRTIAPTPEAADQQPGSAKVAANPFQTDGISSHPLPRSVGSSSSSLAEGLQSPVGSRPPSPKGLQPEPIQQPAQLDPAAPVRRPGRLGALRRTLKAFFARPTVRKAVKVTTLVGAVVGGIATLAGGGPVALGVLLLVGGVLGAGFWAHRAVRNAGRKAERAELERQYMEVPAELASHLTGRDAPDPAN